MLDSDNGYSYHFLVSKELYILAIKLEVSGLLALHNQHL